LDQIVLVGPASQALALKVAQELGVKAIATEYKQFPDGENYLRWQIEDEKLVKGKGVIIVQTLGAGNGPGKGQNDRMLELFMMIDSAKRMGAGKIKVVVPYLAYSRQDKVFRPGECKFAELVLRLLESCGADEFFTIDVHAPEIFTAVKIQCHSLDPMKPLADYLRGLKLKNPVVVSPDKGSRDRSAQFAASLGANIPVVEFDKKRDVKTGEVKMVGNASVGGKEVIIADDIIATGGTMSLAIKIAKESGASRVFAVATHPLLIGNGQFNLINAGAEIIGTDCIDSKFSQVSMAKLIADAVRE
jgi:ribose-phosphate pyrophosphokinase